MTDDRADYLHRLILARCPELTDADLVALASQPSDTLPAEIAGMVLDVLPAAVDGLATSFDVPRHARQTVCFFPRIDVEPRPQPTSPRCS